MLSCSDYYLIRYYQLELVEICGKVWEHWQETIKETKPQSSSRIFQDIKQYLYRWHHVSGLYAKLWTSSLLFQDCLLIVRKIEFWGKQQAALGTPHCLLPCSRGKRICLEYLKLSCLKERCTFIKEVRYSRSWGNVLETRTLTQRTVHVSKVFAILKHFCAALSYRMRRSLLSIMC